MEGIFTLHLITLLFSPSSDTLSDALAQTRKHRHAAKQSRAYPGMSGWVPSDAAGEAAWSFQVLTGRYVHTVKKTEEVLTSVTDSSSCKST